MPPRAHAHGGGDEEEVIIVRTDGPPFADVRSSPGRGFEVDFDRVSKFLGPGKVRRPFLVPALYWRAAAVRPGGAPRRPVPAAAAAAQATRPQRAPPSPRPHLFLQLSAADFARDMDAINKVYVPTVRKAHKYLRIASITMLGSFSTFIIMGMVGPNDARGTILALDFLAFLLGLFCFFYAKWVEQPGIRVGSKLVKDLLEREIQPRYADSQYRLRWTIRVKVQKGNLQHLGKKYVESPIVSIYALRSHDDSGGLVDWPLPEALMGGLLFEHTAASGVKVDDQEGW